MNSATASGSGSTTSDPSQRNIIERMVGWFKECRRLGTRYEKVAVNTVAFGMVAMIEKSSTSVYQTVPSPDPVESVI